MEIAYCQGINFLTFHFVDLGFEEEDVFWILCYILEQSVPLSYYINLIPVFVDVELIHDMLKFFLQELKRFVFLKKTTKKF